MSAFFFMPLAIPLRLEMAIVVYLKRARKWQSMRFRHGLVGHTAVHDVDAAGKRGLFAAGFFQAEVGEQFNVTVGHVRQCLRGGACVGYRACW